MFASSQKTLLASPAVLLALFLTSSGVLISDIAVASPDPLPDDTSTCDRLAASIKKIYVGVPPMLTGISTERAQQIARDVESGTRQSDRFFSTCAGHAETALVHWYKTKFLHLMSTRKRYDIIRTLPKKSGRFDLNRLDLALEPYYRTLLQHADAAYQGLKKDSKHRPESLEIRGWTHLKLKDLAAAEKDYKTYLDSYKKSDRCSDVTAALGRVYLDLDRHDDGIKLITAALSDASLLDSPTYPHFGDLLWKLNEAKGDFTGMEKAAEEVLRRFPFRAKSRQVSPRTLELFDRTIDVSGFRRPYVDFARGDFAAATAGFREHVVTIDAKEKKLTTAQQELKPVSSIYRERSRRCADFIDNFVGKEAPVDFDLSNGWVTPKQTTLKNSTGKVVAVIFRGIGDARSAKFLEEIDRFCAANKKVELIMITYFHQGKNAEQQVDRLREELLEIGYENAAGFDPDPKQKTIFRTYGAYVGSASFLIFDTLGQPVWFQQDPRTVDINFAKRILERVRDGR